jgi:hypothetical protein
MERVKMFVHFSSLELLTKWEKYQYHRFPENLKSHSSIYTLLPFPPKGKINVLRTYQFQMLRLLTYGEFNILKCIADNSINCGV